MSSKMKELLLDRVERPDSDCGREPYLGVGGCNTEVGLLDGSGVGLGDCVASVAGEPVALK